MLTACSVLQEDGDQKNIRINLPPIVSATGNSRAISDDRIPTLKTETRKYRVTVNGMTREGTDSSYEFTLTVGTRATVTVECLNSSGDVIIRAVKDFTVAGGENSVSINLKADGTEITPASAQNQVTYNYGDANNGGEKRNLPANEKVAAGETFTVPDVSQTIYWAHGAFTGWSASVGLEPDAGGSAVTTVSVAGGAYIMPSGGVTLTARWTATPYTINYDTSISGGGSGAQASGGATSFTMAESDDKQLSSTSDGTGANTFLGWATASGAGTANIDGTSDIRKAVANGSLQIGGNNDVTLYAVWTNLPTHTVTFDDSQLQGQEYWQGNSSNNTVNIIDGRSVSAQQVQSFLNGGAKSGYTLTYNGSGSGAINSPQNFTIDASKVSFNTTYTVTIDFSSVSNEAWWQAGSSTTATKSVAKGLQLSAQDIQTEIDSRKKPNYNVTYSGGNKTVSSASDINVAITTGDLNVKELFSITYSWGTGVTVTAGNLPQMQDNIVQGTNATVTIPTGVTRSGYNFLGWSETDNDTSGTATYRTGSNTITGIGKSYTLYAVWTAIPYTITYDANGGGTNPGNTTFTVADSSVTFASSATLQKQGYSFANWETTGGTSVSNMNATQLIAQISSGTTLALRAKWEEMTELNVSASGDDTTGDGSSAKPFATVQKAFTVASSLTTSTPRTISVQSALNNTAVTMTSGTVTLNLNTYTVAGNGTESVIKINAGSLTLTGTGTITGGGGSEGAGVYVATGATFIMSGCTISNNTSTDSGGGVYNAGTFTMETGSTISGNEAEEVGGGVYNEGTFTLNGGTISGNSVKADRGGGVYNRGTFTMNAGSTISGNRSIVEGAGVDNEGTFTMEGGSITGNMDGQAGVDTDDTFTMNGGTISGNTNVGYAFGSNLGVLVNTGTFTMSGGATVAADNPIWLDSGTKITVNSTLTASSAGKIGLRNYTGNPQVLDGSAVADNYTKFTLADSSYTINSSGIVD